MLNHVRAVKHARITLGCSQHRRDLFWGSSARCRGSFHASVLTAESGRHFEWGAGLIAKQTGLSENDFILLKKKKKALRGQHKNSNHYLCFQMSFKAVNSLSPVHLVKERCNLLNPGA